MLISGLKGLILKYPQVKFNAIHMLMATESIVRKKMATGTFSHNSKRTKIRKPLINTHKNAQKRSENFKPCIHNVVSSGKNVLKIWLSMLPIGCVRFARDCGKMYSLHRFLYGGLY